MWCLTLANFFGAIEVDIDAEPAQLGPTGYRPLRIRDTLFRSAALHGGISSIAPPHNVICR